MNDQFNDPCYPTERALQIAMIDAVRDATNAYGPHHVTVNTVPAAADSTGWKNSPFSMGTNIAEISDATVLIYSDDIITLGGGSGGQIASLVVEPVLDLISMTAGSSVSLTLVDTGVGSHATLESDFGVVNITADQSDVNLFAGNNGKVLITGHDGVTLGANGNIAAGCGGSVTLTSGSGHLQMNSQNSSYYQDNVSIVGHGTVIDLYGSTDSTIAIGSGISLTGNKTAITLSSDDEIELLAPDTGAIILNASSGITLQTANHVIQLIGLSSSSAGLSAGCLYSDSSVIKIK